MINIAEYYNLANEMLKEKCEKRIITIRKYDKKGNIVAFFNIKRNRTELCGGHIGIYNKELNETEIEFSELMTFLSYCQINGIIIDFQCY